MPSYLGELGALATIKCPSSLRISEERPATVETTIGGRRYAYLGARAHREWDVDISNATPSQAGILQAFVRGDYGGGPWWWVDAWAAATNVLPPLVAGLGQPWRNCTYGGPVTLPDGTSVPQSLIASGNTWIDQAANTKCQIPVLAGEPVTAAAWLRSNGGQTLRADIVDATGTVIQQATGTASAGGAWRQAVATITTVADGAHHAEVAISGPGRIAAPTVTWTRGVVEYSPGEGAATVIVTADGKTITRATREVSDPLGRLADVGFTITEVGPQP